MFETLKNILSSPQGALIGAAVQNRSTIAKAVIALIAVLLLPVMFILMLPGLIFGNLSEDTGALNNNSLVNQNIQTASQAIVGILEESHDDILTEIEHLASHVPENDTVSITDPYASNIHANANLLISQFCAGKDNYKEVNVDELQKIIRQNKAGLFSYEISEETITLEIPAEDTLEEEIETVTYTRHSYVVTYSGDSYFADNVFHLSDAQKETASAYAENLTAFFGSTSGISVANVSDNVLAYKDTVENIASLYGMSEYVELILAVMMQESGGNGLDVMQATESSFNTLYPNTPNGITDPTYSITCGIQALQYVLTKAGCTDASDLDRIKLALQGYNYGPGYIDWAMERDGGYTRENAIAYSDMMCARPNWNYSVYGDKEYAEHVLRYYTITSTSGTYPANGMQIPHYLQTDYSSIPYGSGSIASSGCGPTCFAMIASYLTETTISPIDAVSWCGNTYYISGQGTSWSYFSAATKHFGCGSVIQTTDPNEVLAALSEGQPVISSQSAGLFTSRGHFIVLRGVTTSGKVLVNDPNDSTTKNYISREFDMMSEIHSTAKAYWIFNKK